MLLWTQKKEKMLEENKPKFDIETGEELVTANEGGLIGYSNGGYQGDLFNPYFYQKPKEDNTVDERYSNEAGEIITKHYKLVDGIKKCLQVIQETVIQIVSLVYHL